MTGAAETPKRPRQVDPWAVASLALGVLLLLDVQRVFLPSLITIFGRAAETPAEQLGLFALLWFLLPFAIVPFGSRIGFGRIAFGGAVLLALIRVALQATDGGQPQLLLAAAGTTAGLLWLYGCAHTLPRRAVPVGLIGGLTLSTLVHVALGTVDFVWRDGVLPWVGSVALVLAFLVVVRLTPREQDEPASSAAWFLAGPVLLVNGVFSGVFAHTSPVSAHPLLGNGPLLVALFLIGHLAAVVAARYGANRAVAFFVVYGVFGFFSPSALFAVLMAVGLAGCLAVTAGAAAKGRQGLALLLGMVVFVLATFGYYAAYDLGYPNQWIPAVVAAVILGIALRKGSPEPQESLPRATVVRGVAVVVAVALLVTAATWPAAVERKTSNGDSLKLIAYNIRMGFGLDGTLALDRIAEWARDQQPDVVLLSEVDRGWMLNGGHDGVARLAERMGMRHYFAPAADPLWGDAILTNLPVTELTSRRLDSYGAPTGAQVQSATVEVGRHKVTIVNTHLQAPAEQARDVARLTAGLAEKGPVILAGDMNVEPGEKPFEDLIRSGLVDGLAAVRPLPTSPADNPAQQIDHVFVTAGLKVESAQAPRLRYSDHLPVMVTVRMNG
ncbi:endonuclease/exonuclease/phosphatase family protein [Rhizohabitans arisaemae]|uniref:endonuclease/exonuclease/phosphatase family protein n=1 Tax=Rhizohabitans arisaemae TaxID=2720610 RepID=UPI0024B069FC|nr:endonuclease/exonuclease/phosphatase family protein [Rhizohabitans arisaemae]